VLQLIQSVGVQWKGLETDARTAGRMTLGGAVLRRCALFGAHLGKGCASSKESSGFSKMRTFENGAHLRRGLPRTPVPLLGRARSRCFGLVPFVWIKFVWFILHRHLSGGLKSAAGEARLD
jgi:hypothetical protein